MNLIEDLNKFYEFLEKSKNLIKSKNIQKKVYHGDFRRKEEVNSVKDLFSQITAAIPYSKIEGEWYIKTGKDKMYASHKVNGKTVSREFTRIKDGEVKVRCHYYD